MAQTGSIGASSAVPQERLLQCHLSWDVSGWAFPVTEAERADMCYKILLGLVTGEGKGDVGEAERQFHPTSPQGLCHLLATSLGSYLISLNFSFFFSDDKPAHQAVKLQHA